MSTGKTEYIPQMNIPRTLTQIPGLSDVALLWLHEHLSREIDKRKLGSFA